MPHWSKEGPKKSNCRQN
ncbi:UNVERIFIED_CONTAM: hypothetical protein H355_006959 [Colinus virginianus]|nr:hypothetical protein H355_006959 [Colinus virginianus]